MNELTFLALCSVFIPIACTKTILSYPIFIDALTDLRNETFLLQTFIFRAIDANASDVVQLANPAEEHRFRMPMQHLYAMESFYHGTSDTFASTGTPRMYVMRGEQADGRSLLVLHERNDPSPLLLYNDANRLLVHHLQAKRWNEPPRDLVRKRDRYRINEYWPLLHYVTSDSPYRYPCGRGNLIYVAVPLYDTYADAREGWQMREPLRAQQRTRCLPFQNVSIVVLRPELELIYVGYFNASTRALHSWLWSIDRATKEELSERPILANVHCPDPMISHVKMSTKRRDQEWIILRVSCQPDEIGQYFTLNLLTKRSGVLYRYDHYPHLNGLIGPLVTFNEFDDNNSKLRMSAFKDGKCLLEQLQQSLHTDEEMRLRLLYTNWTTVLDYPKRFIDPCCECHARVMWRDNEAKANETIKRYCPYTSEI